MSGAEFRLAATRVSTALWMAIEALDTEALALRALAARADPDGSLLEAADQAERDASLQRGLADGHVPTTAGAEP